MLVGGPLALSVLFLVQANAQVEAGTRLDSRAGEAPVVPGEASRALWISSITPSMSLALRANDSEWQTSYAPRFLWSVPNRNDPIRPLILQTLVLANTYQPSRRSRCLTSLRAIYGQEDSVALAQLLPGQAALPTSLGIFSGSGTAAVSWRSTRRIGLAFEIGALHRRPLEDQASGTSSTSASATSSALYMLRTQTTLTATPSLRYTLSRRMRLEFSVPTGYTDSSAKGDSTPVRFLLAQPQIAWNDDLSRWSRLNVVTGLSFAEMITRPQNYQGAADPVTPIVGMSLDSILVSTRSLVVHSQLSAQMSWYLDPVLGTAVPRAPMAAQVDAAIGPHWNAGVYVTFVTDASARPLACNPNVTRNGGCPDETFFSAGIPIRYTWARQVFVEFGGRFMARAPHLRVPAADFRWGGTEIWATLTLSAANRLSLGPSMAPSRSTPR